MQKSWEKISVTEDCAELTAGGKCPKLGLDVGFPGRTGEIHNDEEEWTLSPEMKTG